MSLGAWGMEAWILLETLPTSAGLDPCASIFFSPIIRTFSKAGRCLLCLHLLLLSFRVFIFQFYQC